MPCKPASFYQCSFFPSKLAVAQLDAIDLLESGIATTPDFEQTTLYNNPLQQPFTNERSTGFASTRVKITITNKEQFLFVIFSLDFFKIDTLSKKCKTEYRNNIHFKRQKEQFV